MNTEQLIFGNGQILRDKVDGWATSESGVPHVYPDHPPLDLAARHYPRATVDTIGQTPNETDIDKEVFTGEVLLDLTVYATNSRDISLLVGEAAEAIAKYHDETNDEGEPYLPDWEYLRPGTIGPIMDEETQKNFTRYSKTVEHEFEFVSVTE